MTRGNKRNKTIMERRQAQEARGRQSNWERTEECGKPLVGLGLPPGSDELLDLILGQAIETLQQVINLDLLRQRDNIMLV